jgi:hypothetical protein
MPIQPKTGLGSTPALPQRTNVTPMANVTTTPMSNNSQSGARMKDFYSNEGYANEASGSRPREQPRMPGATNQDIAPTIGKVPVIHPRRDAELQAFSVWIPAPPKGLSDAELSRQIIKETFRRNGVPMPERIESGDIITNKSLTKRTVNGQEQTGYPFDVPADTQAGYLRNRNSYFTYPATRVVIGDEEFAKMIATSKREGNPYVADAEWKTGDVGRDNILELTSRLVSVATRIANGEENPKLDKYYQENSAKLRSGVVNSNAAGNVNGTLDQLDDMIRASRPQLANTALSTSTLGLFNVAGGTGGNHRVPLVDAGSVDGLPERAANDLRAKGVPEESVNAVKGVFESFVAMRKTAGKEGYEAHRAAFEQGLKNPLVTKTLSKGEIDFMRNAAAPINSRDNVGSALPKQLIPQGEQLLADLKDLKASLDSRNGHSFNTLRSTALERNQAEINLRRIPDLEAAIAKAKNGDAGDLQALLNNPELKFGGGPKKLQKFLDDTDKAGMRGIEWVNDTVKPFLPPGMSLTVTTAWELVKYGRGDNKTLEATAMAIFADAAPNLLGMDKLPGGGKEAAKMMIKKGGAVFAANLLPAMSNISKDVFDGKMSPAQGVRALQGEIAKASGKAVMEMGVGVFGGMLKQASPEVRHAIIEKTMGFLNGLGYTPTIKDFMQDYADRVK